MEEKILAKVRHLLDKTVAAGCTESEALAAAAKAAELLDKYGLELSQAEGGATPRPYLTERQLYPRCTNYFAVPLARYCGVKVFRNGHYIVTFGREENLLFFAYLAKYLSKLCVESLKVARRMAEHPHDVAPKDFWLGFGSRISALVESHHETRVSRPDTGNALILFEESLDAAFAAEHKVGTAKPVKVRERAAFMSGWDAGAEANLSRPLSNSRHPKPDLG